MFVYVPKCFLFFRNALTSFFVVIYKKHSVYFPILLLSLSVTSVGYLFHKIMPPVFGYYIYTLETICLMF